MSSEVSDNDEIITNDKQKEESKAQNGDNDEQNNDEGENHINENGVKRSKATKNIIRLKI